MGGQKSVKSVENEGTASNSLEPLKDGQLPGHMSGEAMTEAQKQEEIKRLLARLKQLRATPRSDWHREFEDALQLDIESWANGSWVLREVTLGEDAPRIDFISAPDACRGSHPALRGSRESLAIPSLW